MIAPQNKIIPKISNASLNKPFKNLTLVKLNKNVYGYLFLDKS